MKRKLFFLGIFGMMFAGFLLIRMMYVQRPVAQIFSSTTSPSRTKLLVAVVPHHDIVKEKRREILKQLSLESQPDTILLLSPNHFGVGKKSIVTTDYVWQLRGGEEHVDPDTSVIQHMIKNQEVENYEAGERNDHGITNLLGDIHEFFPNARIVPLLLRDTINQTALNRLESDLFAACDQHCGVIASVDMSHYQPAKAAAAHDVKTIRTLETLDSKTVWNVEVDSRASLAFLMDWAQHFSLPHFNLAAHTNSGELTGNIESETTTHIMGYYEPGTPTVADSKITFTLAGSIADCPLDQPKQTQLSDFGGRALWGADVSWAFWNVSKNNLQFRDRLMTLWHWPASSLQAAVTGSSEEFTLSRADVNGMGIVLVSADARSALLEAAIQREAISGAFVIVLPRWERGYTTQHSDEQKQKAALWIRAGADMIVGFHEGGLQDMEVIDGVPVFYSLGQFLRECGSAHGMVLNGVISKEVIQVALDPVSAKNFDAVIVSGQNLVRDLRQLCPSNMSECLNGYIELPRRR